MPRLSLSAASAYLWHALYKFAELRLIRSALPDNSRCRIDGRFVGRVAGYDFDEPISCVMSASGPVTKASSHSAPTDQLLAHLLEEIPASRRQDVMDRLLAYWSEYHELPDLPKAKVQAAKKWKQQLNHAEAKSAEGPVSCQPDPDPEALAAAEAWAAEKAA